MKKTEEGIINFINKNFRKFRKIKLGIGDDCAIIGNYAITKDIYIEGTHFNLNIPPEGIGWRTFAGALSDIAAIGGEPLYFLLGIGLPQNFDDKFFKSLMRGMMNLSNIFKVQIIGGDTVKSEKVVLSYTVFGKIKKPILRNGARSGDFIYITGDLGLSRIGYDLNIFNEKFLYPLPKIREVKILTKKYKINSMIDISDGLVIDSERLSFASSVRLDIYSDKIPFNKKAVEHCKKNNLNFVDFCINSGEEYELLFTSPEKINLKFVKIIGEVKEGKGVYLDGKRITHKGFKHFNED